MKESRFYQEILQEGREEGREKGREEGTLTKGRNAIVLFLQARFKASVPAEVVTALEAIDDSTVLDELIELAATCKDVQDFQADPRLQQPV